MAQHKGLVGPITVNDQAKFSPDMVIGYHPDSPRLELTRNHHGITFSQTTHVQAASNLENMWRGYHPDTPMLFSTRNQQGIQLSQTTHVQAKTDSPDMWRGSRPDTSRQPKYTRVDVLNSAVPTSIFPFTFESARGFYPDKPVLFYITKVIGDQVTQETPVIVSVFSNEMVLGARPIELAHLPPPGRLGPVIFAFTDTPNPLSVEMFAGNHPDFPREFIHPKLGSISFVDVLIPISIEMFRGSFPDARRPFFGPLPTGRQLFEGVPVANPFGPEMVYGQKPDTKRPSAPNTTGNVFWPVTVGNVFTSLMTGGLSFTGAGPQRNISHVLTGGLSFSGAFNKLTNRALTGAVSFVGGITKFTQRGLSAALTFVGNIATALNHGGTHYTQAFTAGLSFVGSASKRAGLSFVGFLSANSEGPGGTGPRIILVGKKWAIRLKGIIYEFLG